MIVENIDFSDKYNLVILKISDEEFLLSYDFYNDLMISVDQELSFDDFKKIVREDQYNKAKNYALAKISFGQKTSFELEKLLKEKNFDRETISRVILFLNEYGLIDDELYVRSFVNDKHTISKWPINKIRYALKGKKIDDTLIEKYISEIDKKEEYQNAYDFAIKKTRNDFSLESKQKVFRYLAGKGFDFDIINRVIGEIFKWHSVMSIF